MRADVLADLLAKLDDCAAEPDSIAEFRRLIESVGARHGFLEPIQARRVGFARQLLDARQSRTDIRDRLMARFSVGESQAYRDIQAALKIVPIRS